jgi:hypothetical protein
MQMKYQDRTKDLRRRLTEHKREPAQFAVPAKIRNFSWEFFPTASGARKIPGCGAVFQ